MSAAKLAPKAIIAKIITLFEKHGHLEYGEAVSLWQHAQQTAKLAIQADAADELILAAFLHDLGHFPLEETGHGSDLSPLGHVYHDQLAAKWLLENGFSEKICAVVGGHVEAKRYLCRMEAGYFDSISEASQKTLVMQGGPMALAEARMFEGKPHFREIIQLRRWDDGAKDVSLTNGLPDLIFLKKLLEKAVQSRPQKPQNQPSHKLHPR